MAVLPSFSLPSPECWVEASEDPASVLTPTALWSRIVFSILIRGTSFPDSCTPSSPVLKTSRCLLESPMATNLVAQLDANLLGPRCSKRVNNATYFAHLSSFNASNSISIMKPTARLKKSGSNFERRNLEVGILVSRLDLDFVRGGSAPQPINE